MSKDEIIKRDIVDVLKDLPELCYARRMTDGCPVLIKRGVMGYWQAKPGICPEDENEKMGVNVAQEMAMVTASIAGFDCPGADPLNYTDPTLYARLEGERVANRQKYAGKIFPQEDAASV